MFCSAENVQKIMVAHAFDADQIFEKRKSYRQLCGVLSVKHLIEHHIFYFFDFGTLHGMEPAIPTAPATSTGVFLVLIV
jgi:hypothetical protein